MIIAIVVLRCSVGKLQRCVAIGNDHACHSLIAVAIEWCATNLLHRCRYGDFGQCIGIVECTVANFLDTLAQGDSSQCEAVLEGLGRYLLQCAWQTDAFQLLTILEGIFSQCRQLIADFDGSNVRAIVESLGTDAHYITQAIDSTGNVRAVLVFIVADCSYLRAECQTHEAAIKRWSICIIASTDDVTAYVCSYRVVRLKYRIITVCAVQRERCLTILDRHVDVCIHIIESRRLNGLHAGWDGDCSQCIAFVENTFGYFSQACGYREIDGRQRCATVEGVCTHRCQTTAESHAGKLGSILEQLAIDSGNLVAYGHARGIGEIATITFRRKGTAQIKCVAGSVGHVVQRSVVRATQPFQRSLAVLNNNTGQAALFESTRTHAHHRSRNGDRGDGSITKSILWDCRDCIRHFVVGNTGWDDHIASQSVGLTH